MHTAGSPLSRSTARNRTRFPSQKTAVNLIVTGLFASAVAPVYSGAEFKLGDEAGVTAGIGLRTSFQTRENAAPNGSDSNDFVIDNARLFFSGHYGKIIKGTFNTDYKS